VDRAAEAASGASQQNRRPRPTPNPHQTILFDNRNRPRRLSPKPNHPSANRAFLLCTVFPARTPACFLPNQEVCFARNLFVPRVFPSRKHLRILSGSIAGADPCRTGPHVQNGLTSQRRRSPRPLSTNRDLAQNSFRLRRDTFLDRCVWARRYADYLLPPQEDFVLTESVLDRTNTC
jgi:hypothetical protein